jgi:two-component system, LytTR family, sensor kinase
MPVSRRFSAEGLEFLQMERTRLHQVAMAYLISIGIWSALSLLTGWQYFILDQAFHFNTTLTQMLELAEVRGLTYACLTPPIFYIVNRYASVERHRLRYLLVYFAGAGPFMLVYTSIRWVIFPPWIQEKQEFGSRAAFGPLDLIKGSFADLITIYFATLVAAHAFEYFNRVRKQELERSQYQQALAASELQALKMQIHPHFLFNTLNGISTLIDSDGRCAKAMIVKLSSLLRKALEHSGSDLIPLHEELTFIGEYLDLEKMRFGPRLTVRRSIDHDTRAILVPQLILQPLVENAIRYGVSGSREKSWIEILARRTQRGLELQIRNNVAGNRSTGTGLGLRNTAARLKHLYSDEATFRFEVNDDRTAAATLILPAIGSYSESAGALAVPDDVENEEADHARTNSR